MFHTRCITFPRSKFWRCLGMLGWSSEFFGPLHGSVLLRWTQHPCGLARLGLALTARRGSKLNIFSSAGLQREPVGKWQSLQQRPAFSHTAVFIILTSTCNDTLSPSLFPSLSFSQVFISVSQSLFSPGFITCSYRSAKIYMRRNRESCPIFLSPSAKTWSCECRWASRDDPR